MLQPNFLPESMYELDPEMNHEKLTTFYENNTTVTGKVTRLNSKSQICEVKLGGNLVGFMSFHEASIYPFFKSDGEISPNLYHLVGKNIRAKIIGFNPSNNIPFLSRKEHMLAALEFFKNETNIITASITAFSRLSAFLDIGAGIMGRAFTKDFSTARFHNVRDIGFEVGNLIPIKIISFWEEENKFNVSRVATSPSVFDVLSEGDVTIAKVFDPVYDREKVGYFALVDQKFNGIVDSPDIKLNYGDMITVFIKKIKKDGHLKLTLVKS